MSAVGPFRVANASDSGNTSNIKNANTISACCQPKLSISATPNGANTNCPNEPAAVPAPSPMPRHSDGNNLPNAESTRLNEQPDRPKPISTTAPRCRPKGAAAEHSTHRPP